MPSKPILNMSARLLVQGERLFRGSVAADRGDLNGVSSFLVLEYSIPLGNAVHASPIFEALHQAVPGAFVAMACSGMPFQVHQHSPFIQQVIKTTNPYQSPLKAAAEIRKCWRLAGRETSCILTPVGSERTKVSATAFLSGPGSRVGYTLLPKLFHRAIRYEPSESLLHNNLALLQALGHRSVHYEPRVFFTPPELESARSLLRQNNLDDGHPIAVFVTQTSKTQFKGWRDERFIALANHMKESQRCHIIFVGTAEEDPAIQTIQKGINFSTVSLAGKTSIPILSALLCMSDIALTLDTGIMHLGRAAQVPMCIIAPAWSPAIEWLPLDNDLFHVHKNGDSAAMTTDYIIDEVSVEEIRASVDDLLRRHVPSAAARQARIERNLAAAVNHPGQ